MTLKTDLIGYWALEETSGTRYDSHTNALHMTDVGSTGSGTGKIGTCLYTGVSAGYLQREDEALLSPTAAMSFSAWVKGGADLSCLAGSRSWNDGRSWAIVRWSNGEWRLACETGSGLAYGTLAEINNTTDWFHLVMTYDGAGSGDSGRLKGYVNGSAVTLTFTGTVPAALPDPATQFAIGTALSGSGLAAFQGYIDEVAFWSRAISSTEVSEIYNAGAGLAYSAWDATGGLIPAWMGGLHGRGAMTGGIRGAIRGPCAPMSRTARRRASRAREMAHV